MPSWPALQYGKKENIFNTKLRIIMSSIIIIIIQFCLIGYKHAGNSCWFCFRYIIPTDNTCRSDVIPTDNSFYACRCDVISTVSQMFACRGDVMEACHVPPA